MPPARFGIAKAYLGLLEQGRRRPSIAVASDLAAVLDLEPGLDTRLFQVARPDAGRSWREDGAYPS